MGDAVGSGVAGQVTQNGYYSLDRMPQSLAIKGVKIGLFGTSIDARGTKPESIAEGARRSSMEELTVWTTEADRGLVYWKSAGMDAGMSLRHFEEELVGDAQVEVVCELGDDARNAHVAHPATELGVPPRGHPPVASLGQRVVPKHRLPPSTGAVARWSLVVASNG